MRAVLAARQAFADLVCWLRTGKIVDPGWVMATDRLENDIQLMTFMSHLYSCSIRQKAASMLPRTAMYTRKMLLLLLRRGVSESSLFYFSLCRRQLGVDISHAASTLKRFGICIAGMPRRPCVASKIRMKMSPAFLRLA
jgi:hypothetical protein